MIKILLQMFAVILSGSGNTGFGVHHDIFIGARSDAQSEPVRPFSCADTGSTFQEKLDIFLLMFGLVCVSGSLLERIRGAVSSNYWKPRILALISLIVCCLGIYSFPFTEKSFINIKLICSRKGIFFPIWNLKLHYLKIRIYYRLNLSLFPSIAGKLEI